MLKGENGFEAPSLVEDMTRLGSFLRKKIRLSNSKNFGRILILLSRTVSGFTKSPPPSGLRALISTGLPIDPLKKEKTLPPIDIVLPFVEKDIEVLKHCVEAVVLNVRNPIACIRLITPADKSDTKANFADKSSHQVLEDILGANENARVEFDHEVLGPLLTAAIKKNFPGGWVVQQLVKFAAALNPVTTASLTVDSDTILLSPKTWLAADGTQLLQIAHEYEERYMGYIEKFFGIKKNLLLSFVTHHTLLQKDILDLMFPQGPKSLLDWWVGSEKHPGAVLAENEAYGSFVFEQFQSRVALGSWSNLLSPYFTRFEDEIIKTTKQSSQIIPDYCSVSFHAHCQL